MSQLQLAYKIAVAEKGVKEVAGIKNNERILDYHQATMLRAKVDEAAWCSAFVNWCYIQAGILFNREEMKTLLEAKGVNFDALDHAGLGDEFVAPFEKAPVKLPTFSPLARHWLSWGSETKDPQPGDLVVLRRGSSQWQGHVGFFVKRDPLTVTVFGGNQDDQVKESRFLRVNVLGYRTEG